ncbi:hypothetical protein PENPOL_c009G09135 [Penicillium polonicum]|uniref:Uncharacterized protein n=1 Tax=Penicillium polonicum TaxID=60169 RepID=A0A1V6NF96_PENPO|nr:hypothetical protein PENPOL_c009G09135 [Penicillium polonicum]
MVCDERRPRCRDCELRGYFCQWGLNVSFHPSRTKTLSSDDREALSAIEKDRTSSDLAEGNQPRPGFSEASFRDDTPSIISDYHILTDVSSPDILASSNRQSAETTPQNANWKPQPGLGATQHTPNPPNGLGFMLNDSPSPTDEHVSTCHNDGMATSLQLNDLHENPEAREETVPQPNDHSRSCEVPSRLSIYDLPFSLGHAISWDDVPLPQPLCPITKVEGARLISLYLRETGEWCETTDSDKHFTIQSIHEMMESDCFVAAAMALASRQRDAVQRDHRPVTLELYQAVPVFYELEIGMVLAMELLNHASGPLPE